MSRMMGNTPLPGQNKVAYPMKISLASSFCVNLNLAPRFAVACSAFP